MPSVNQLYSKAIQFKIFRVRIIESGHVANVELQVIVYLVTKRASYAEIIQLSGIQRVDRSFAA